MHICYIKIHMKNEKKLKCICFAIHVPICDCIETYHFRMKFSTPSGSLLEVVLHKI
jgi:hypothetical protein